jgi:hypothetical protein
MSSARKKRENCQLVLTESINGASSDNSSQTTYLIEANELGKSDQDLKLELVRPHNSSQRNAQSYLSIIQIFKVKWLSVRLNIREQTFIKIVKKHRMCFYQKDSLARSAKITFSIKFGTLFKYLRFSFKSNS